jgi:RpiR family transcriptional regulator, carbohydrate utilization regulator
VGVGDTLALVRRMLDDLPPGEAQVARVILGRPFDVLYWSAADLAAASETSTATVVRACHRLGFGGLPDLRMRMARDIGWAREPAHDMAPPTEPQRIAQGLFRRTAEALGAMAEVVDGVALKEAVEVVIAARRLLIAAVGPTQVLAYDLAYSLNMVGRPAELPADMSLQQLAARSLESGDVLFAVSLSGTNPQTLRIVEVAREAGASVVLVSCFASSRISELATVTLVTGNHNVVGLDSDGPVNSVAVLLLLRSLAAAVEVRLGAPGGYRGSLHTLAEGMGLGKTAPPDNLHP